MKLFDHSGFILNALSYRLRLAFYQPLTITLPAGFNVVTPLALLSDRVYVHVLMESSYAPRCFSALWRSPFLLVFASISMVPFLAACVGPGFAD